MHTVPRMHMAADETRTRVPSNTSAPDRYGQPACQHDMAGASFTRRAHTWICATRICMRALLHIYNTMVAHMCVCACIAIYVYITTSSSSSLSAVASSSFGRVHYGGCSAEPLSDVHVTQNVTAHAIGVGGFDQAFGDHLRGHIKWWRVRLAQPSLA